MSDYSLQGLDISTEEFISAFAEPHEIVYIRVFSDRPKEDSIFTGCKYEQKQALFSQLTECLKQHNAANRGVFFTVNHGGHNDKDITRINAQFAEIDNLSLEEQLELIKKFPLPPSLIVKTRKSLHCYWLVRDAKIERFRHIQKQLVAHFGADPACINESRVMRLPRFYHTKQEHIMVECIKFNPELRYTQDELSAALPFIPEEPSVVHNTDSTAIKGCGVQKGLLLVGRRCEFNKFCKRNAKTLPEPLWYALITNLAIFVGGVEAIHSISKPHPNYSYEETERKIEHFLNGGKRSRHFANRTFIERRWCPESDSIQ